jgi:hypothetical protein
VREYQNYKKTIKNIFKKCDRFGLAQERVVAGSSAHDNEPSGSITRGEFLDKVRNYQLLKRD